MSRALAVLLLSLIAVLPALAEDELPYPKGSTSQTHAGAKEHSLVVVLHGSGGTETGMAGSLQPLAKEGFVVCAPKSSGSSWTKPDIDLVKVIVKHLDGVLSIGKGRMHSMGFSAGGWALAPLAFDEKLHFVSACWVAAGFKGASIS
ncbi:MAG: alpha/beta hydrolase family protein [Planctomycetota bacterium]|jgi:poly(3-hydroxybutyrate) depolymerase